MTASITSAREGTKFLDIFQLLCCLQKCDRARLSPIFLIELWNNPKSQQQQQRKSNWPKSRLLWASSSMIGSKRKFNSAFYAFNVYFLLLSWNSNLSSFRCLSKRDWVDNIGKSRARSDCGFMVGHWNMISCRSGTHKREPVIEWKCEMFSCRFLIREREKMPFDLAEIAGMSIHQLHPYTLCVRFIWTNWNVQIEACAHCRMH